jgi:3-vinyl bacteriochlorophyllide hydratase
MRHPQTHYTTDYWTVVQGMDVNIPLPSVGTAELSPTLLSRNLCFVILDRVADRLDCCPWGSAAGRSTAHHTLSRPERAAPLYTAEERRRRDASPWTMVQGVLAPVQFAVFLVSLSLVLHYLATGHGLYAASASVVVKTCTLYAIMITGSIWEHEVFGRYLFARAFFWEDVFSMLVLALHTAYLAALWSDAVGARGQMLLALAAYASYAINATQFVLKLRAARRERDGWVAEGGGALGVSK